MDVSLGKNFDASEGHAEHEGSFLVNKRTAGVKKNSKIEDRAGPGTSSTPNRMIGTKDIFIAPKIDINLEDNNSSRDAHSSARLAGGDDGIHLSPGKLSAAPDSDFPITPLGLRIVSHTPVQDSSRKNREDMRRSRTIRPYSDIKEKFSMRKFFERMYDSNWFFYLFGALTFLSLFLRDLWIITFWSKNTDVVSDILLFIILVAFVIESCINWGLFKKYRFSVVFFLDALSTLTIVLDTEWFYDAAERENTGSIRDTWITRILKLLTILKLWRATRLFFRKNQIIIVEPIVKSSIDSIKAEYVKHNKRIAEKLEHIAYFEKDSDEEEVQVKGTSFRDNLPIVNAHLGSRKQVDDDSKQNLGKENSSAHLPQISGDPQSQPRQTEKRKFSLTNPATAALNLHQRSNAPPVPTSPANHNLAAGSVKQSSDDKGERSVVNGGNPKLEKNMLQSFGQIALGFLRREPSLILHKQGSAVLSEKERPPKPEKNPVQVYSKLAREYIAKDQRANSLLGRAVFSYKMKHAGNIKKTLLYTNVRNLAFFLLLSNFGLNVFLSSIFVSDNSYCEVDSPVMELLIANGQRSEHDFKDFQAMLSAKYQEPSTPLVRLEVQNYYLWQDPKTVDRRQEELMICDGTLSEKGGASLHYSIILDNRGYTVLNSLMSILRTIVLILILVFNIYGVNKDTQQMILDPLDAFFETVDSKKLT